MRPIKIAVVVALAGAWGAVQAARVEVQAGPEADFADYRTFQWRQGTAARRPTAQQFIVQAVERELQNKGLARVTALPDLYVVTHALVDRQSMAQLADAAYFDFVTGITNVDAYDMGAGTLVVDLVDAATEQVVWRGVASDTIKGSLESVQKRVDRLVSRMFRQFVREP